MATSTAQSTPDTVKDIAKKSRSVKRTVKAGRPVGAKKRSKKTESMTSQLFRQGKDAVSGAYETAAKAGRALPKMPSSRELRQQGHTVYTMMEERPLVMGAVGLGVGIALAALLPSMRSSGKRR